MAVQLKGQSTWEAKAMEARLEAAARLWSGHKLKPNDVIRFPRHPGVTTTVEGRPLDVAPDGSITCSAGGRVRSVLPARIEVKMSGPRGGVVWEPLVPDQETA